MNHCASVCCLLLLLLPPFVRLGSGQNLVLASGQIIETKGIRRDQDLIMCKIQVCGSSGEVGYRIGTIARIDFPEPPQLKTAAIFLSEGDPAKALADIGPVVKYYEPFRDLPGNWWARAALLQVSALGGMQLDKEAEALGKEIQQHVIDPETARSAQLQLVPGLIRSQQYDKALQICDQIIKESTKAGVQAEAWVNKGDAFLAEREFDRALMAYLHVPIFYLDEMLWMPPALLGSARAFRGLDDLEEAKKSLADLTTRFPKSPQAKIAQAELKKLPPHEKINQ